MSGKWIDIDLNCDLGEGIAPDDQIIPLVSSCNMACGGHAGDLHGLVNLLELAVEHGTKAGAHPSYPDRENFGRISMTLTASALEEAILGQLQLFSEAARRAGSTMNHIKAHGALYNDLSWNVPLINLYLHILQPYRPDVLLYAPCGSIFVQKAREAGFGVLQEGFADRAYHQDGRLVSRTHKGAVHSNPRKVWDQVFEMVRHHRVATLEGSYFPIVPETLCVHGDTPNALKILTYLRKQFSRYNIRVSQ